MLFPYRPLLNPYNIQNLNLYYNHFFENLFQDEPLNINILIHPDFMNIYTSHNITIGEKLRNIHQIYLTLNNDEKQMIKQAFEDNRQVENICNGTIDPIKYDDLSINIKDILKSLYNTSWTLLTNKDEDTNTTIKEKCGNIYEHYCSLFQGSRQIFTICPVCGLEELLGEYESCDNPNEENQKKVREAYDHYFPKKLYPFISVDFSNLIPICHHCNSTYKHDYDTAYNHENGERQENFFPFSRQETNGISISIANAEDIVNLYSSNLWQINTLSLQNEQGKVSSWNRIFDIASRYKKRIKTKEKVWKNRLIQKVYHKSEQQTWEQFKIELYSDIEILNQSNGVIQKAYYDYFFENLVDGYLEEVA